MRLEQGDVFYWRDNKIPLRVIAHIGDFLYYHVDQTPEIPFVTRAPFYDVRLEKVDIEARIGGWVKVK